jgi:hypothetical protein
VNNVEIACIKINILRNINPKFDKNHPEKRIKHSK